MRLRLSGRSSDLSRIQIQAVADALRTAAPEIEIQPHFRESLGDRMQDDPLWAMPEKGVFTEDFVRDLREGKTDLVVHSWKDLPTEPREGTRVVATLPRADVRDLLLVHRERWSRVEPGHEITILSSSPRRAHNLAPFLAGALPVQALEVKFEPVRGNVPTRVRKLVEGTAHGLIVAKAALDRLLGSTGEEFEPSRTELRTNLGRCHWMILPVSANPTGAAQGALAVEARDDLGPRIASLLDTINHPQTFDEAESERRILRSYGGGCHQKIGVTVLTRPYGRIVSLRGLTDAGELLETFDLERKPKAPPASPGAIWPTDPRESDWMSREPLDVPQPDGGDGFWIARADALPASWELEPSRLVWCAGLHTWRKLAERGIWVNGTSDGLGEIEAPEADHLAGRPVNWIRLTHDRPVARRGANELATYRLVSSGAVPDLSPYSHFFWTSGSRFLEAIERHPEIRDRWHACGPGHTYDIIRETLGSDDQIDVWLSHRHWLEAVTP